MTAASPGHWIAAVARITELQFCAQINASPLWHLFVRCAHLPPVALFTSTSIRPNSRLVAANS